MATVNQAIYGKTPISELLIVRVDTNGNLVVGEATTRKRQAAVTVTSIVTVWTPASGKTIILYGGDISLSAAESLLLEDHTAASGNYVWSTPKLEADKPFRFVIPGGVKLSAADHVLKATSSGAAALTGVLYGVEV